MILQIFAIFLVLALGISTSTAAWSLPVQLKPDEQSLNGLWRLTLGGKTVDVTVPEYGVNETNVVERHYRRNLTIPADWAGKRIRLEFEMVNFATDLWLRDLSTDQTIPLGSHVGGWSPFAIDLTEHVSPGRGYELIVNVEGMHGPRTKRPDGYENHPIGNQQFTHSFDGIVDHVWLRAYGTPAHIVDTFISPTFSQGGQLRVIYRLKNTSDRRQTVTVQSTARPWSGNAVEGGKIQEFPAHPVELGPGEEKDLAVAYPWSDAQAWWPDHPFLYTLTTVLSQEDSPIDRETRRFGFREFTVDAKAFRLNGVITRLRGDYLGFPGHYYMDQHRLMPDKLAQTYRYLQREYNFNAIRWHQRSAPRFCFDIADEVGMLIVCESSVYGRPSAGADGKQLGPMPPAVKANYLVNAQKHLAAWTRIRRNHPSVILWSPVNEMGPKYLNHQRLTFDEIEECLAVTRGLAADRPIVSHGNNFWLTQQTIDRNPEFWNDWPTPGFRWKPGMQQHGQEEVVSYHYPGNPPLEDGPRDPRGKPWIYTWDYLVNATDKPVGFGEYFQTAGFQRANHPNHSQAQWMTRWFGLWNRGLRYLGAADYRPKLVYWAERIDSDLWRRENLAKTNAPVALFDRDYDEEGIRYWTSGFRMHHAAGVEETRRFWLFNDDFRGQTLTLEVQMIVAGQVLSTTTRDVHQPLGTNSLQTLYLVAPNGPFSLQRRVVKNGSLVFEDTMEYRGVAGDSQALLPPRVSWESSRRPGQ